MRSVVLMVAALAGCTDLPSRGDLRDTVGECRDIVADALPDIVGQCSAAATLICGGIGVDLDNLAERVLVAMGCYQGSPGVWDCRDAAYCYRGGADAAP